MTLLEQLNAEIAQLDAQLESAETSIVATLPAGRPKTWLQANPDITREILSQILDTRKEVL